MSVIYLLFIHLFNGSQQGMSYQWHKMPLPGNKNA